MWRALPCFSPGCRRNMLPGLLVLLCFFSPVLSAQQEETHSSDSRDGKAEGLDQPEAGDQAKEENPCKVSLDPDSGFFDLINRDLYVAVCASSRWFDTFFGDARAHDEESSTYGSILVGLKWTEYDGLEEIARARINFDLPNLSKKYRFFLGRVAPDEFVQDSEPGESGALPDNQRREDEKWMFGLGFTPLRNKKNRFSLHVGIRMSLPFDPYTKLQYRHQVELSHFSLFRFRQTVFWYRERGFGTTTNLDLEIRPRLETLVRLSGRATIFEESEGVEWRESLIVFRRIGDTKAVSLSLWVRGKTEAPISLTEYGVWGIYRKRLHREWLFVDFGGGVSWPRKRFDQRRESSLGVSIDFQIQFGDVITGTREEMLPP